jgi:hypothetical protein
MVIPGTAATTNSTDRTASSTEILGEDEATHVVAAAPFVISAEEMPNRTLSEDGELDGRESECEVNEENLLNGDHSKLESRVRQINRIRKGRYRQLLQLAQSRAPKTIVTCSAKVLHF